MLVRVSARFGYDELLNIVGIITIRFLWIQDCYENVSLK